MLIDWAIDRRPREIKATDFARERRIKKPWPDNATERGVMTVRSVWPRRLPNFHGLCTLIKRRRTQPATHQHSVVVRSFGGRQKAKGRKQVVRSRWGGPG